MLGRLAGLALLGVVLGLVGTPLHRAWPPGGLLLALLMVFSAAVLARAWSGWAGMLALALTLVTVVGVLAVRGPGGDVLVAAEPLGYVWYASGLVVALAAFVPRRWLSDRPLGAARA